ncbi:MAG: hypothetical protein IJU41_02010 [Clostridia bacterium]|nr:hypothetical protein [Clostridia bacterium]
MKFRFYTKGTAKTLTYVLYFFFLFLFAHGFLPALSPTLPLPNLTIPALCLLAMREDGGYASVFAIVFGTLDAAILDFAVAPLVLFYLAVTLLSARLFSSFFSRGFLPWLGYTLGWLLLFALFSLFSMVSAWQQRVGAAFLLSLLWQGLSSLIFAIPNYPILRRLTRRFRSET